MRALIIIYNKTDTRYNDPQHRAEVKLVFHTTVTNTIWYLTINITLYGFWDTLIFYKHPGPFNGFMLSK